ncbi:chemotaxis protein CheW [Methanoplanus endosymbiosus]|uniref:Chemotaxis protein CheW n=1 Tax=Methanoplanus endosymbiosus TaxID=33865 RepID=A0A9E7TMJ6_9EURY|nr:chemotaxis protein CheW [Methanoplanus endosymbiosus]UUX93331.1 chemotaxis protein CheW [Methanoplanus endosymbiosus]
MEITDVVQFQIGNTLYALDIHLAREIVEMMPITPVPRAPDYIAGIINLRGEITNILNLNTLLGLENDNGKEDKKIIVLVPDAANGSNVGIIVDNVHSVLQVSEDRIENIDNSISSEAYVRGVIKTGNVEDNDENLVIWIDIAKILEDTLTEC